MSHGRTLRTGFRFGVMLLVILLVVPAAAVGQVTPGYHMPSRESIRNEYIANIMKGLDPARRDWAASLRQDDVKSLMNLYTGDAVLIPPDGVPIKGRDAIREFWQSVMPQIGSIQTGLADLDASGEMAMVAGGYTVEALNSGSILQKSGSLLTVYVQVGSRWLIRAQAFSGHVAELSQK